MIGSFSAASNISGILTDTETIATLLHKYGAYAFFDYATAGIIIIRTKYFINLGWPYWLFRIFF